MGVKVIYFNQIFCNSIKISFKKKTKIQYNIHLNKLTIISYIYTDKKNSQRIYYKLSLTINIPTRSLKQKRNGKTKEQNKTQAQPYSIIV